MSWFKNVKPKREPQNFVTRLTTYDDPLVIYSPRLGIFNLMGESGKALSNEDKNAFSPIFPSLIEGKGSPPVCDVLILYCSIEANGKLIGTDESLREIIHASQAPIVLIASPNLGDAYIAAAKRPGIGIANLVMILDRKEGYFALFFQRLFNLMKQGKTMPVAWVELAPQAMPKGFIHPETPESIFFCECGQILFK